ncbi:MAG: molybdenum cofactor biosynthesis protein MoaE [Agriterribacter sp.]
MNEKTMPGIFIKGAISTGFIGSCIHAHQSQTGEGAHNIFLGQVRADKIDNKQVVAIEYTCFEEMAAEAMDAIGNELVKKYALSCLRVYHSVGIVKAGEICLFVFASAPHRKAAIDGCEEAVELIKKQLPIWGREILDDETHQWKVNQ